MECNLVWNHTRDFKIERALSFIKIIFGIFFINLRKLSKQFLGRSKSSKTIGNMPLDLGCSFTWVLIRVECCLCLTSFHFLSVSLRRNIISYHILLLLATGCPRHPIYLFGMNGTFTSPNYPGNYPNNAHCEWRIMVPYGYHVRLSFTLFDTENGYDFVEVSSNSTGLHGSYTGIRRPPPYLYGGRQMRARFRSDGSVTRRGFRAVFTAVYGPPPAPTTQRPIRTTYRPPFQTTTRPGEKVDHKRNSKNVLSLILSTVLQWTLSKK